MFPRTLRVLLLILPIGLAACRDSKVVSYRIPKESDAAAPLATPADHPPVAGSPGLAVANGDASPLVWTAPAHWKAKTRSAMRKGSYTIGEEGAAGADMSITAFPGDVGGDLANVNRWRGQLELPSLGEAELAALLVPVEANGLKMQVVDLVGGPSDKRVRMLGAIVPHAGATWFFKLTGADAVVAGEKSTYLEFLQTVKESATPVASPGSPAAAPVTDMSSVPVPKADGADLKWVAPPHWLNKPASAMRKATYIVADEGGATAELSITAFPGAVGGELANVNRWRGQLQLPPLAEAELSAAVTRLSVHGLTVTVVDLTGGSPDKPIRLLGAIVPSNGANWFFKFTGPVALVSREQASFLAFLQTLQAP